MGVSVCGLLVKKKLSDSDLEQCFGKKIEKKGAEPWQENVFSFFDGNDIAVLRCSTGTLVYHGYDWIDQYTDTFKTNIQKIEGCSFAMSSISMAASFVHYLPSGTCYDSYLYEEEFIKDGPNILGITEKQEFLFDDFELFIYNYIGELSECWENNISFYSLSTDLTSESIQEQDKKIRFSDSVFEGAQPEMKSKVSKILILFIFVALLTGSAVWMYKMFVVPNSPYNTEIKLRGTK